MAIDVGELTWERAAALWVEWGGVSHEKNYVGHATLTGTHRVPRVFREGGHAWWASAWGVAVVKVSLTHDTLEDMAEACGLPRTPGRVAFEGEIVASLAPEPTDQHAEQHAGYKAALDAFCGVG